MSHVCIVGFLTGLSAVAVEDVDDPFGFVFRAADEDRHEERNHFPGADDFEFSRRSDDGRARDHEAADFFDGLAKGNVLTGSQVFVVPTDGVKCVAGAELEATADESDAAGELYGEPNDDTGPHGPRVYELRGAAAARGAGSESSEGRADSGLVRLGVGVDEEEDVARGHTSAGVADGGD